MSLNLVAIRKLLFKLYTVKKKVLQGLIEYFQEKDRRTA